MGIFTTKAKAGAKFNTGITRQQAWNSLASTFNANTASLVEGSYPVEPEVRMIPGTISVGDVFHTVSPLKLTWVQITECVPNQSLAFEELFDPQGKGKNTTRLEIIGDDQNLSLNISYKIKGTSILGTILARINAPRGLAYARLAQKLGPERVRGIATEGWTQLPIDAEHVTVEPYGF